MLLFARFNHDATLNPTLPLDLTIKPIIVYINRSPDFMSSEHEYAVLAGKAYCPKFREFTKLCFRELHNPSDTRIAKRIFRDITVLAFLVEYPK